MNKNLAQSILFVFAIMLSTLFAREASAAVVINEIYTGGGNGSGTTAATYNQDFVELYNNGTTSVDITGYSLQYAPATGTSATSFDVCAITGADLMIEPGTYFLIATGPVSITVGTSLPTADFTCSTGINLAAVGGKLALVSSITRLNAATCPPMGATIVDFVGYGTGANCFEGIASAPAPANNQSSIQRTPIGTDTNNNATDFKSISPPSPRTALSPTAAMVDVGGRVRDSRGRGINRALIRMMVGTGVVRTTYTNLFGYYKFVDVEVGQTLIFDVRAKRYDFNEPTQVVSLSQAALNINFTAY